jgi:hypothetical protein
MGLPKTAPKKIEPVSVSNAEAMQRAREIMESAFPEIAQVLTDAARDGDVAAGRLVAERLMPVARSAPIRTAITLTGDAAAQAIQVKDLIAAGKVSLEEGEALLHAIDVTMKVCREVEAFRRSEAFWKALLAEINAESEACALRIMTRVVRLQRERGLVIEAEANAATLPAPKGDDDEF